MKEPYVHVGIMSAPTISFRLFENYVVQNSRLEEGKLSISSDGSKLLWNGNRYDEPFFTTRGIVLSWDDVKAQIEAGGAAGFYAWLLAVDLEDFGPSTRPCLTEARQDLIELGKPASDRFIEAWLAGDTLFPIKACALECLYDAFVLWRARGGDLSRENRLQFSKRISRFGLEKRRMRVELWPNWYDPEDHSGLPPGKIRSQQQVFLPADSDPAKANEEILDFQVVVNRARKDLKRV